MISARHTTNRQSFKKVTCLFKATKKQPPKVVEQPTEGRSNPPKVCLLPKELLFHSPPLWVSYSRILKFQPLMPALLYYFVCTLSENSVKFAVLSVTQQSLNVKHVNIK